MDERTCEAIRKRAKELGLSLRTVATEIGVDPVVIYNWMNGKKNPRMDNFYALLSVLGLEIIVQNDPLFESNK